MRKNSKKAKALAWLLCLGITATSVSQTFLYGSVLEGDNLQEEPKLPESTPMPEEITQGIDTTTPENQEEGTVIPTPEVPEEAVVTPTPEGSAEITATPVQQDPTESTLTPTPEGEPDKEEEEPEETPIPTPAQTDPEKDKDSTEVSQKQDAYFDIGWSDEGDLAERRKEISQILEIYADGVLLENSPYTVMELPNSHTISDVEIKHYKIEGLLVYQEGTETKIQYTLGLKEDLLPGYEKLDATALKGTSSQEDSSTQQLLNGIVGPSEILTLESQEGGYFSRQKFGNYLRAYEAEGRICWGREETTECPAMEEYFANQFVITRGQEVYRKIRIDYSKEDEKPDQWSFKISGLFTTDEDGQAVSYYLTIPELENYVLDKSRAVIPAEGDEELCFTYISQEKPSEPKGEQVLLVRSIMVKNGTVDSLGEEEKNALINSLNYTITVGEGESKAYYPNLEALTAVYPYVTGTWNWQEKQEGADYETATFTLTGIGETEEDPLEISLSFDPEASSSGQYKAEEGVNAEGPALILTRTGTTGYCAVKQWLDHNERTRPSATWNLYRVRKNQENIYSETDLEPVLSENGSQVQWVLTTSLGHPKFNENNRTETLATNAGDGGAGATLPSCGEIVLPKYDENGNEYVYFAKEIMDGSTASSYKAYLGQWNGDSGTFLRNTSERVEADAVYVAAGETLTNRLEENQLQVTEQKTWIADKYKDDLNDVSVVLTLQSRRRAVDEAGAPEHSWADVTKLEEGQMVPYTKILTGFDGSHLTQTVTAEAMPRYDGEGKELEYRWVETGIIQNGRPLEFTSVPSDDEAAKENVHRFQLSQNIDAAASGEEYFESYVIPAGQPYAGTIVNRLIGSASYHVEKQWDENITEEERGDAVTVTLEQRDSRGRIQASWDNVKITKEEGWKLTITQIPDGEGGFTQELLPKYDANGAPYNYVAIEEENALWMASYQKTEDQYDEIIINTKRQELSGTSKVLESNGSAKIQLVWRDVSEKAHTSKNLPVQLRYKVGDGRWGTVDCQYENGRWIPQFTDAQKKALGISESNLPQITEYGENELNRQLTIQGLPSKIQNGGENQSLDVQWDIRLDYAQNTTYVGIENPETRYIIEQQLLDSETTVQPGNRLYDLTPTMDFVVNMDIRNGYDKISDLTEDYFEWFTTLTIRGVSYQKIMDVTRDYPTAKVAWSWDQNTNKGVLTITGLPWCDENKADLDVYVTYNRDSNNPVVGNYVEAYDNSMVANFGSCTEHAHNGGTLILIRIGTEDFYATKQWLDDNTTQRPRSTWTLWRYANREGAGYQTAAQVRDNTGNIVYWVLNSSLVAPEQNGDYGKETVSINYDPSQGERTEPANTYANVADLPRYDPDGYEYIYFVKEEMAGGNEYVQNFGVWNKESKEFVGDVLPPGIEKDEEGNRKTISRTEAGGALFMGGTLTNRAEATVAAEQKKTWEAENYQTDIKEAIVELVLQSRILEEDTENGKPDSWKNVTRQDGKDYTVELTDFKTETAMLTARAEGLPKYDEDGKTLEYRWVERAVYENEEGKKKGDNKLQDDGTFKLAINDAAVDGPEHFVSELEEREINGQKETIIVNKLVGTTDYFIEKTWKKGFESIPDSIHVILEQRDSADNLIKSWEQVTVYAKDNWKLLIDKVPDGKGGFTEEPLPKYDENGEKYTYMVVEEPSDQWNATYTYNRVDSQRDVDNLKYGYNNVLIANNRPGESQRLKVRKQWLDNGDSAQRKPVTIEVWGKTSRLQDEHKITEVTLNGTEDWWDWVSVGEYRYEEDGKTVIRSSIKENWKDDTYTDGNGEEQKYGELGEQEGRARWQKDHFYDSTKRNKDGYFYYIREVSIQENSVSYEDLSPGGYPTVISGSEAFKYEVMYTNPLSETGTPAGEQVIGGGSDDEGFYTVRNRRIGQVNLTVTKEWIDGGKSAEERAALGAKLVLVCEDYPGEGVILDKPLETGTSGENSYGYIRLPDLDVPGVSEDFYTFYEYSILNPDGTQTGSQQQLGNTKNDAGNDGNTETVYFFHLPKYDAEGGIVHYTVMEEDPEGKLKEGDYTVSIEQTAYTVTSGCSHTIDTQEIKVTNQRQKTEEVNFHKKWIDQAVYEAGNRPDIFLTLYRAVKNADGEVSMPKEMGYIERKWDKSRRDSNYYWTCTFENLERYADDGSEYVYYASENVSADAAALDYIPVQYAYGDPDHINENKDPSYRGPELTYLSEIGYGENGYFVKYGNVENWVKALDGSSQFVLQEEGTFVNQVRKNLVIHGKKVWENVPVGFPMEELPKLNFILKQKPRDGAGQEERTVAEIQEVASTDLSFDFIFRYAGINDAQGNYTGELTEQNSKDDPSQYEDTTDQEELPSENGEITGDASEIQSEGQEAAADLEGSTDENWKALLPKYDPETGALYSYSVRETITNWTSDSDLGTAYIKLGGTEDNSYLITNTYRNSDINVKKITVTKEWKQVTENFPETEFTLYRFFELDKASADGKSYSALERVAVQKLDSNCSEDSRSVEFDNLLVFALNGNPYIYFVQETKVSGYLTTSTLADNVQTVTKVQGKQGWPDVLGGDEANGRAEAGCSQAFQLIAPENVEAGKNAVPHQTASASVAYINTYEHPEIDTVSLQGTKSWMDDGNGFNTRPNLVLKVYRWAERQASDGTSENAIGSETQPIYLGQVTIPKEVTKASSIVWTDTTIENDQNLYGKPSSRQNGVTCTITEVSNASAHQYPDSWTYTFQNLDRYSPNGNPWIYKVVEAVEEGTGDTTETSSLGSVPEHYTEANNGVASQITSDENLTEDNKLLKLSKLENKMDTVQLTARKVWELLVNVERPDVVFALQVKEGESGNWQWAAEYFQGTKALANTYKFDGKVSGTIEFQDLPKGIVSGDDYCYYYYRVREVKIGKVPVEFTAANSSVTTYPGMQENASSASTGNKEAGNQEKEENAGKTVLYPGVDYASQQPKEIHYRIGYHASGAADPEVPTVGNDGNQSFTITNTPEGGVTSLSVTKRWDDFQNAFHSRLENAEGNQDWTVYFGIFRKWDGNDAGEQVLDLNGKPWTFSINPNMGSGESYTKQTLNNLPKYGYKDDGTPYEYTYYVKEFTNLGHVGGIPLEDGADLNSNQGYTVFNGIPTPTPSPAPGTEGSAASKNTVFMQTVTNTLKTIDLTVTKMWEEDQESFRPADLEWGKDVFLYRSTYNEKHVEITKEDVTYFVHSDQVGTEPPIPGVTWTKTNPETGKPSSIWTCTIKGLPYCDPSGRIYNYTVKETTQDGYLEAITSETEFVNPGNSDDQTGSETSTTQNQAVTLRNRATKFQLDKIGDDTPSTKLNGVSLTFTGVDASTSGWKLEWKRDQTGMESYKITKPKSENLNEEPVTYGKTGSEENKQVIITGLPLGTYELTEESTPYGYESAAGKGIRITLSSGQEKTEEAGDEDSKEETETNGTETNGTETNGTETAEKTTVKTSSPEAASGDVSVDEEWIQTVTIIDHRQMLTVEKVDGSGSISLGIYPSSESENPGSEAVCFSLSGTFAKNHGLEKETGIRYLFFVPDGAEPGAKLLEPGELIATKEQALPKDTYVYTLTEIQAPEEYNLLETELKFTMNEQGEIQPVNFLANQENAVFASVDLAAKDTLLVRNYKNQLTVLKTDEEAKLLKGVRFGLYERTEEDANPWIAVEEFHETTDPETNESTGIYTVEGLKAGSYKLVEEKAPAGYLLPAEEDRTLYFEVDSFGKITESLEKPETAGTLEQNQASESHFRITGNQVLVNGTYNNVISMSDSSIQAELQKIDTQGQEVDGAKFAVRGIFAGDDGLAEKVEKTIELPRNGSYCLDGELIGGNTYQVTEIEAPAGYLALTDAITLVVGMDGVISIPSEDQNGYTEDARISPGSNILQITNRKTSFQVRKVGSESTEEELSGATLAIYRKEDFDENAGQPVSGEEIHPKSQWETGVVATITGLETGSYVLCEVTPPEGYRTFRPVEFTLSTGNVITITDQTRLVGENEALNAQKDIQLTVVNGIYTITMLDPKVEISVTPEPSPSVTPEPSPSVTPEPSPSVTPEPSPSVTPEPSPSVTPNPSPSVTPNPSPSVTPNPSPSVTPNPSPSVTPEPSPSVTPEPSPSVTPEPGPSVTPELSPSITPEPSPSVTPEPSPSVTPNPSPSVTPNPSPSVTPEPSPSVTPNPSPSVTPEPSPSVTPEPSPSVTPEPSPSVTPEPSPSVTPEPSPSVTPEPSPSVTPEPSPSVTPNPSPSVTPNPSPSVTPEPSPSVTPEPSPSVTPEPSPSVTPNPGTSVTPNPSPSVTPNPSPSVTPEPSLSVTPEPSPSVTPEPSPSVTPEPSPSVTPGTGNSVNPSATPTVPVNSPRSSNGENPPDSHTRAADNVQTGDDTDTAFYLLLLVASGYILTVLMIRSSVKRKKNHR